MGDDVEASCLVKECRELERAFGTKFTEEHLKDNGDGVPSDGSRRSSSRLGESHCWQVVLKQTKHLWWHKKLNGRWYGMQLSV